MKYMLVSWILLLVISCSSKQTGISNDFLPGEKVAELKDKHLGEVSGLANSITNPNLFWTLNDSGNKPNVFLIDKDLQIKTTYTLQGVKNRDWEDIAVGAGPDPTKNYVYVAEIGDNSAAHKLKFIYRFEEPIADPLNGNVPISNFDTITFKLPDEQKDTETLMIDPATKDLYIVSKREDPVYVYQIKYPYSTKDTITAERLFSLPLTQIVAGGFSPDGNQVLMKNYNHIYYWANPSKKPVTEVLREAPLEIPYEVEPQGESISWSRDNTGFYTLSEKNKGKKSFLYFYRRK
jgi:hypothetical protein